MAEIFKLPPPRNFPRPQNAEDSEALEDEILDRVTEAALDDVNTVFENLPDSAHEQIEARAKEYEVETDMMVVQYLHFLTSAYVACTTNLARFRDEETGEEIDPKEVLTEAFANVESLVGKPSADEIFRSISHHTDVVLNEKFGH